MPAKHSNGYLRFDPALHFNHSKPWKVSDEKYMCEMYELKKVEDIALALGRTAKTIAGRMHKIRKRRKIK